MEPSRTSSALPPEALTAHAGFVRRIACALLRDPSEADDATQETLTRGLTSGPRDPEAVRPWLATVVRNAARRLRRQESRFARREREAARPEGTGSTVDAAARAETLRLVGEAVAALDEPERTAILLRHYDDLPPRVIAERLGIPLATVKSRLQRAHQRLRTRLGGDGRREGERRWSALAAFAGWPQDAAGTTAAASAAASAGSTAATAGAVGGGMAMAGATKIALGVAALVACAAGAWVVLPRADDGPRAPAADPTIVARAPATPENGPPPTLAPAPLPAAKPPGTAPAGAPAAPAAAVDADVLPAGWVRRTASPFSVALPGVWTEENGPAGALVFGMKGEDGRPLQMFGVFGAEGARALEAKLVDPIRREVELAGRRAVWLESTKNGNHAVFVRFDEPSAANAFVGMAPEAGWPAFETTFAEILRHVRILPTPPAPPPSATPAPDPTSEFLASLATPVAPDVVAGTVLVGSTPIAGAKVEIRATDHTFSTTGLRTATTDADGRFSFAVTPGGWWNLGVEVEGLGRRTLVVSSNPNVPRTRTVVGFGSASIAGTLYLRTGAPAAACVVRAGPNGRTIGGYAQAETTTDATGAYHLAGLTAGQWIVSGILEPGDERNEVITLKSGEAQSLELGSARPEATWRGVVRLASGSLVTDPAVSITLNGPPSARLLSIRIGPDGKISQRLPPGRYRGTVSGIPGMPKFELVMDDRDREQDVAIPGVRLEGTVTWRALAPVPPGQKAQVAVVALARDGVKGEWSVATTPDGRFQVSGVTAGRVRVWATFYEGGAARSSPPQEIDVRPATDVTGLRLEVPD